MSSAPSSLARMMGATSVGQISSRGSRLGAPPGKYPDFEMAEGFQNVRSNPVSAPIASAPYAANRVASAFAGL